MKIKLTTLAGVLLLAVPIAAHRLDEYLQATTIELEKDHVHAQLRLTPGVHVAREVLAVIDTNRDGAISKPKQEAYAKRVVDDLSLTFDGTRLQLRLISATFPAVDEMKKGVGNLVIDLDAEVPAGGTNHKLIFENKHQSRIASYLVNCLIPRDSDIRITAQQRNYLQSTYQLDYAQNYSQPNQAVAGIQSGQSPPEVRLQSTASARGTVPKRWLVSATVLLTAVFGFWFRMRARTAK
jgi:hypothetical protein